MPCNNKLSLIHFCKQITGYYIASVNYRHCIKAFISIREHNVLVCIYVNDQ